MRSQSRRQLTEPADRRRVAVHAKTGEAGSQKVDEIAAVAAPRVEYTRPVVEPPPEELVEQIDVDAAEPGAEFVRASGVRGRGTSISERARLGRVVRQGCSLPRIPRSQTPSAMPRSP